VKKIILCFFILILEVGLMFTGCSDSSDYVAPSDAKAITSFSFEDPPAEGIITEASHSIAVTVPFGTDVTTLIPTIVHTGVSISPESGEAQDFTAPVAYTVTADDSSTQDYTITVTIAPSGAKGITSFSFEDPPAEGTVTQASYTIDVTLPAGSVLTALIPTIVHTGASISPESGEAQDFTDPVVYTVTAVDSSTQDYTVTVTVAEFICGDALYYAGEIYSTVQIGMQCWLARNLNIGTMVLLADGQDTSCEAVEKYCYGDDAANCSIFGGLYTWTQAMCEGAQNEMAQGICPPGWHIPSDPEYVTLTNFLDEYPLDYCSNYRWGNSNFCGSPAGDKMKAEGLCQGRDFCGESGFNGLLGGVSTSTAYGSPERYFLGMDTDGVFWTSSINSNNYESWRSGLAINQSGVDGTFFYSAWDSGRSIRCVKD